MHLVAVLVLATACEPGGEVVIAVQRDCDGAIKPRVTRLVHLAHATRAKRREDFIRPELVSWGERHVFPSVYQ